MQSNGIYGCFDHWISNSSESILGFLIQYLIKDWKIDTFFIAMKKAISHKAIAIGKQIKEILMDWSILVQTLTTNNENSECKTVWSLNIDHIRCSCHSINLVIQHAIEKAVLMKELVEEIHHLSTKIRNSLLLWKKLKSI